MFDPLSRDTKPLLRLITVTAGAAALTTAAGYLLAPVKSERLADWPLIVWASLRYAGEWVAYVIRTQDWNQLLRLDMLPFVHGLLVAIGSLITAGLLAAIGAIVNKPSGYGDSRHATAADVRKMGLNGRLGPVLGRFRRQLLLPTAPRSTLVLAPTRKGKTRGIVIPTILTYPGTKVVIDPKRELLQLTAGAERAQGRQVYVIEWTDAASPNGWNPLGDDLPADETALERALERQAAMLFPKAENAMGDGAYWMDNGRRNYVAQAMFEVYDARREGRAPKLAEVAARLAAFESTNDPEADPFGDMLKAQARTAMTHGYPSRISDDLLFLANIHPKERGSHLNTLLTGIQLWRGKAVATVTAKSDFTWPDLRRAPSTVYVTFPQSDAKAYGPLTAIFLESLFAWAIDTPADKKSQPILIVGEEFASLPKIPLLFDVLAKGNGMGIHLMVILQDLAQFKEIYGQTGIDQLITNSTYLVAFGQANKMTADTLTALVGKTTRQKRTRNRNPSQLIGNTTITEEGVPLIRPEQWGQVPFGFHILLAQDHFTTPVYCKTPFWDRNKAMRRLMKRGGALA